MQINFSDSKNSYLKSCNFTAFRVLLSLPIMSSSSLFSMMKKSFKYFILIFLGIMVLWYFFFFQNETLLGRLESIDASFNFLNDEGCKYVANPFDPRILQYYEKLSPLECDSDQKKETSLVNGTLLLLNPDSTCRYRYFGHNSGVNDDTVKYDKWIPMNSTPIKLVKDLVDVSCLNKEGIETYRYLWSTVIPQNVSIKTQKPFEDETEDQLSFIMIGMDSMSRSNMFRQMPNTLKMLDKLGFITMEKHVKVGENSYPNLMPILLGEHAAREYNKEFQAIIPDEDNVIFDNWTNLPFFTFGEKGYASYYSEDWMEYTLFNSVADKGFIARPPTDHYFRPWTLAYEKTDLYEESNRLCYHDTPLHKIYLNHLESFLKGYDGKRRFVFHWYNELSHSKMNTPQYMDDDLVEFLSNMESTFNKSIVIIFSDHGQRITKFRQTSLGRLEAKIPFLSVRLPEWFKKKHSNLATNLKKNSKVLTSHFDLHGLLKHTLQGNFTALKAPILPRGISLLSTIPHRTCFEAEIPSSFCPCFEEVELSPSNGTKFAVMVLQKIHDYFKEKSVIRKCLWMKLNTVTSLSCTIPTSSKDDSKIIHYRVQFSVKSPSNAMFEGVVIEDESTGELTALNDIERVNRYGNTSKCVDSPILRKLCHCV